MQAHVLSPRGFDRSGVANVKSAVLWLTISFFNNFTDANSSPNWQFPGDTVLGCGVLADSEYLQVAMRDRPGFVCRMRKVQSFESSRETMLQLLLRNKQPTTACTDTEN